MFEEIKQRVLEGRWHIVNGWWVQPDCNLPSGESFIRHGLYSQRYFLEKFGVTAKVGYNVDSFGHSNNLPQILKKSGMDYYVFMRPMQHEKAMSSNVFKWEAPDGSSVLAYRIPMQYCANFNQKEHLDSFINSAAGDSDISIDETMVFYGVGNHGGGPTKLNLSFIKQLQEEGGERKLHLSGPIDFFKQVEQKDYDLKTVNDDLQHHASGCYAVYSNIKKLNRSCENRLATAEKFAVLSGIHTGMEYPYIDFHRAWERALFIQFHGLTWGLLNRACIR